MAVRIGIITGLAFEAALVTKISKQMKWGADAPVVRCVGMGAAGAADVAGELAALGVGGLMSFGLAGGLDPALKAGTLVVPETVATAGGPAWPVDAAWRSEVLGAVGGTLEIADGAVLAGSELFATVAAKQAAWQASGAVAADMESAEIAAAAQAAGLRFAVVRAVADEAGMALPPAAAAMGKEGKLRPGAIIASILRQPTQIPSLIKLGLKTQAANRALEDALRRVGQGARQSGCIKS